MRVRERRGRQPMRGGAELRRSREAPICATRERHIPEGSEFKKEEMITQ